MLRIRSEVLNQLLVVEVEVPTMSPAAMITGSVVCARATWGEKTQDISVMAKKKGRGILLD